MRYSAEQKAQTRQRILDAAAVVFRRLGFQAGSVDTVMAEAGLTAGGFYAHFRSKEDLFAETFLQALRNTRTLCGEDFAELQGRERIQEIIHRYLSPGHRNAVDQGCPMPPLLADLPRQESSLRADFQQIVTEIVSKLDPHLPGETEDVRRDQALAMLATLIGGITLARAVAEEEFANRILSACRGWIETALEFPPPEQKAVSQPKSRTAWRSKASSSRSRSRKKSS